MTLAIVFAALLAVSVGGYSQTPTLTSECEDYLREQYNSGADLLQLLSLKTVVGMPFSVEEWDECRFAAVASADRAYQRSQTQRIQEMKQMLRERRTAHETAKAQCRASGGYWSLAMGRCK